VQSGTTALMIAATHDHANAVVPLLEAGADYSARNSSAQTALDVAAPGCTALLQDAAGIQMRVSAAPVVLVGVSVSC
jgi:hypothetical protein